jgi:hypothetical protein
MLAPALVIGVAVAARRMGSGVAGLTLTSPVALVFGCWTLITLAACADLVDAAAFPPGQLAGWALVVAAVLACIATGRNHVVAEAPTLRVAGFGGAQTRG